VCVYGVPCQCLAGGWQAQAVHIVLMQSRNLIDLNGGHPCRGVMIMGKYISKL
jgi:hypothetical protein